MIRLAEAVGVLETPACRSDAAPAEACSLLAGCGGAQGWGHEWRGRHCNQLTATGGVHAG